MTPQEELDRAYDTGLRNGKKSGHDVPSPETRERLTKVETNYNNMVEKMEEMKEENNKGHEEIRRENKEGQTEIKLMIEGLAEKIDRALESKANVWVEKVIWGTIAFILLGFFTYVGALILQATVHINK